MSASIGGPIGVIDFGQYDGQRCTCHDAWWGIVPPPPCPRHGQWAAPVYPAPSTTFIPWPLSDDDVDRIARRVAELLREAKP